MHAHTHAMHAQIQIYSHILADAFTHTKKANITFEQHLSGHKKNSSILSSFSAWLCVHSRAAYVPGTGPAVGFSKRLTGPLSWRTRYPARGTNHPLTAFPRVMSHLVADSHMLAHFL